MKASRAVHIYYAYQACVNAYYFLPIIVLFYQEKGLSFTQIMLLQTAYYFVKAAAETPTGLLADRTSRRLCMIAGAIGLAGGSLAIMVAPTFGGVLAGEVIRGVAMSLVSGADSALLYDLLRSRGQADRYRSAEGTSWAITQVGFMGTTFLGGFIASYDFGLTYLVTAITLACGAAIALLLPEPPRHAEERGETSTSVWRHVAAGAAAARQPGLIWASVVGAIVFVAARIAFWLYQPFLQSLGIDVAYFGVIFASFFLTAALCARIGDWLQRHFSETFVFLGQPLLLGLSLVAMGVIHHPGVVAVIYVQQVVWGVYMPSVKAFVNVRTASHVRATILSFQSQVANFAFALLAGFLGALVDRFSMATTLRWLGGLTILATVLLFATRPSGPVARSMRHSGPRQAPRPAPERTA